MLLSGCQRLSDYFEGVKKNYESAAKVLKHNCESNGYGESCYKLGAYHVSGKGTKRGFMRPLFRPSSTGNSTLETHSSYIVAKRL